MSIYGYYDDEIVKSLDEMYKSLNGRVPTDDEVEQLCKEYNLRNIFYPMSHEMVVEMNYLREWFEDNSLDNIMNPRKIKKTKEIAKWTRRCIRLARKIPNFYIRPVGAGYGIRGWGDIILFPILSLQTTKEGISQVINSFIENTSVTSTRVTYRTGNGGFMQYDIDHVLSNVFIGGHSDSGRPFYRITNNAIIIEAIRQLMGFYRKNVIDPVGGSMMKDIFHLYNTSMVNNFTMDEAKTIIDIIVSFNGDDNITLDHYLKLIQGPATTDWMKSIRQHLYSKVQPIEDRLYVIFDPSRRPEWVSYHEHRMAAFKTSMLEIHRCDKCGKEITRQYRCVRETCDYDICFDCHEELMDLDFIDL